MQGWMWLAIAVGVVIVIAVVRKISTRSQVNSYSNGSLDSRLNKIKSSFDDVCKKFINKLTGC